MTGFQTLIGQQRPVRMLCNALTNDRLPHVLLFTGEDGVGKRTAAVELAKVCNCANGFARHMRAADAPEQAPAACGTCRFCKRIQHGSHPDIHEIKPDGAYIRIDQIRELLGRLALRPDEASRRFVLITDAHLMNAEAGNALLKILEEPPEATVFVLTAPDTRDLLPTIVSRCRHLRFNPIPQEDLASYLQQHAGLQPKHAMITASISRGSLARALDMTSGHWAARRDFIIDSLSQLPRLPAAYWMAFSEMLAADRQALEAVFEIMKNWYRDLAVYPHFPENIYNRDLGERIEAESRHVTTEAVIRKTDAIERAQMALAGNANVRLTLDALITELARPLITNDQESH